MVFQRHRQVGFVTLSGEFPEGGGNLSPVGGIRLPGASIASPDPNDRSREDLGSLNQLMDVLSLIGVRTEITAVGTDLQTALSGGETDGLSEVEIAEGDVDIPAPLNAIKLSFTGQINDLRSREVSEGDGAKTEFKHGSKLIPQGDEWQGRVDEWTKFLTGLGGSSCRAPPRLSISNAFFIILYFMGPDFRVVGVRVLAFLGTFALAAASFLIGFGMGKSQSAEQLDALVAAFDKIQENLNGNAQVMSLRAEDAFEGAANSPADESMASSGAEGFAQSNEVAASTARSAFEERARQSPLRLTDLRGRKLVAELIEAGENSLKVRRKVDGRELEVPVELLSEGDREFALYLWESRHLRASSAAEADTLETIDADTLKALFNR